MTSTVGTANRERLKDLLVDVLLIDPSEFRLTLKKADIDTWDSLAIVAVAVGIEEVFGYHPTTQEAMRLQSVQDIIALLEEKGIAFDG
jgi:acyl carrier protein